MFGFLVLYSDISLFRYIIVVEQLKDSSDSMPLDSCVYILGEWVMREFHMLATVKSDS